MRALSCFVIEVFAEELIQYLFGKFAPELRKEIARQKQLSLAADSLKFGKCGYREDVVVYHGNLAEVRFIYLRLC